MVKGANFVFKGTNAAGPAMAQFAGQLQNIQRQTQRMAPINQSWNRGLSENRRAVQQLGFQLTDFTVQIAGGQNALLAFIQQGGQMLQVFGPIGAVLATLLTVFGTLALVIGKSGQSLNEFLPLLGVLQVDLQFLVDAFRVFADYFIGFVNLIANNLDVLLVAVGIWVGRWVMAMALSSGAAVQFAISVIALGPVMGTLSFITLTLTNALLFLRSVMLTILPLAVLVAVSWLITKFIELVQTTGSLSGALGALGTFAGGVFISMGWAAQGFGDKWYGITQYLKAVALEAFMWIANKWTEIVTGIAAMFNGAMDSIGVGIKMIPDPPDWVTDANSTIDQFYTNSDNAAISAKNSFEAATGGMAASWADLKANFKDNPIDVRDMFKGGGGGDKKKGGGGDGETDVMKQLKKELDEAKALYADFTKTVADGMLSGFKAVLNGTKSLKDAAIDMLNTVLDKVLDRLLQPIFSGIANFIGKAVFGWMGLPSFAGGGHTGSGSRAGGMDGKGGFMAMLHPNETVVDHTLGGGGNSGKSGGGGVLTVVIQEAPGFAAAVQTHAEGVAVKVVREYDRSVLPGSVQRISNDPHRR